MQCVDIVIVSMFCLCISLQKGLKMGRFEGGGALKCPKNHKTHRNEVCFCVFSVSCQLTHHSIIVRRWRRCDRWPQIFELWVVRGVLHFLFKLIAQRHEFNPSVVAMAERILITVWMISFQVSLFFIRSLVKGLVFSLFYFGYWLLAIGC